MKKNKKLILPWLPENLDNLYKGEEEIRTNSILQINAEPSLKEHFEIIYDSLNLIFEFTTSYKNQNDAELTLQYLGTRLFNSVISSIKLLLSGYYQGSVVFQRDILEVGYLLDFLTIDRSKISDWKKTDKQQRLNKYKPKVIRDKLDERDGLTEKNRSRKYQLMCEYAVHATYPGFKLVAPKKLVRIGPFLDLKYLNFIIQELAMCVPLFTLIYASHFKNIPTQFETIKNDYMNKVSIWANKHLRLDLKEINKEFKRNWIIATTSKSSKKK